MLLLGHNDKIDCHGNWWVYTYLQFFFFYWQVSTDLILGKSQKDTCQIDKHGKLDEHDFAFT